MRVRAGHSCKVCKRPMGGGVSRADAAKLMENFGHADCMKKEAGSGIGSLVGGAAALAALSQMGNNR